MVEIHVADPHAEDPITFEIHSVSGNMQQERLSYDNIWNLCLVSLIVLEDDRTSYSTFRLLLGFAFIETSPAKQFPTESSAKVMQKFAINDLLNPEATEPVKLMYSSLSIGNWDCFHFPRTSKFIDTKN